MGERIFSREGREGERREGTGIEQGTERGWKKGNFKVESVE
jgi:hypothetical protein